MLMEQGAAAFEFWWDQPAIAARATAQRRAVWLEQLQGDGEAIRRAEEAPEPPRQRVGEVLAEAPSAPAPPLPTFSTAGVLGAQRTLPPGPVVVLDDVPPG